MITENNELDLSSFRIDDDDYYYDDVIASKILSFFPTYLRHTDGEWAGKPVELPQYQREIIKTLYGMRRRENKTKKFNTVYLFLPKKNGKSYFTSLLMALNMFGLPSPSGGYYCCAVDKKQAALVFDSFKNLIKASPTLASQAKILKAVVTGPRSTVFRPLSADVASADGIRANVLIMDEIHRWKNRNMYDVLTNSGQSIIDPLKIYITTAHDGNDVNSIAHEMYETALAVESNPEIQPSFLPIIYQADKNCDIGDENVWYRCNPGLSCGIKKIERMREDYQNCLSSPASINNFKRLNLNILATKSNKAFDMDLWSVCGEDFDLEKVKNLPCYGGLDLSRTQDYSCFMTLFIDKEKDLYYLYPQFWLPEDCILEKTKIDKTPIQAWKDMGYLNLTEGNVIDYRFIRKKIVEFNNKFNYQIIGYDRAKSSDLVQYLLDDGVKMVEFPYVPTNVTSPSKEFQRKILNKTIRHNNNPIMNWMVGNTYFSITDSDIVMPRKEYKSSTNRIDGVSATIVALGMYQKNPIKPKINMAELFQTW